MWICSFFPWDCLTLHSLERGDCSAHRLLCGGAVFGFLQPGNYDLTLEGKRGGMRLELRLCPGANVDLVLDPVSHRAFWRRDPFHYFYNSPAGT